MTIRFNSAILGRSLAWTFPGESDLHRWASQYPWSERGGVFVVAVRDAEDLNVVLASVEEEVMRYSRGQPISCIKRYLSQEQRSLKDVLGDEIGWSVDQGPHHFRERLRIHHADIGPNIYFVETDDPVDILNAEDWIELLSKAEYGAPVCFVFVCRETVALGAKRVGHFTSGALAERLLSTADDRDELQLWSGYVVQRLVWESGGSPGIFSFMERAFIDLADLRRTEATIERLLAAVSRKLCEIHEGSVRTLIENLATVSGRHRGEHDALMAEDLERMGMLWRPRHVPGWLIPGWVARAIASEKASSDPWLLRRSLNCSALTGEVIALCTGIELKIRQQHLRNEIAEVPNEAEAKLTDWYAGHDTEFFTYPSIVSLKPWKEGSVWNDAWAFADLGDLERALRQSKFNRLSTPLLNALGTLRRIRNSIAHGHPVSWNHVRQLRNIADII